MSRLGSPRESESASRSGTPRSSATTSSDTDERDNRVRRIPKRKAIGTAAKAAKNTTWSASATDDVTCSAISWRATASSVAIPAPMTGRSRRRRAGLARRQRRTRMVMTSAMRTKPLMVVRASTAVPAPGTSAIAIALPAHVLQFWAGRGSSNAATSAGTLSMTPTATRNRPLEPCFEATGRVGENESAERDPDEISQHEADSEDPVVRRGRERTEEPDVSGRCEEYSGPVLGPSDQRDQPADDERDRRPTRPARSRATGSRSRRSSRGSRRRRSPRRRTMRCRVRE